MSAVLLVVPEGTAIAAAPGRQVATFRDATGAAELLAGRSGSAVILSDTIHHEALPELAAAVRAGQGPVIEVRSHAWDGTTWSALSAACRGVISGFGPGVLEAAAATAADS
ncbi:MAG: hypothetical protein IT303_20125 [Dehalococcoidia bacterium]|nr:hypothetical protein [Dehalococcoidia bacterium]